MRAALSAIRRAPQDYFRSYLMTVVMGPVLFYVFVAAITGANIRSMWGGPLFCFWGVLLIELSKDPAGQLGQLGTLRSEAGFRIERGFRIEPRLRIEASARIALRNCCIAAAVMLVGLFVRNGLGPLVRDDFSRVHFPDQEVCDEVHRRWTERVDAPLQIIGGQMFPAGCVGVYSDHQVDVFANASEIANPWLDDAKVSQSVGRDVRLGD